MDEQTLERIENYLFGRMSPEEMKAFEGELEANDSLRKWYRLVRLSYDASERDIERDLRKELETWRREKVSRSGNWNVMGIPFPAIAASVVFLLLAAVYLSWASRYGDDELFEEYYRAYTIDLMRSEREQASPLAEVSLKFQQGKYREALEQLESMETVDRLSIKAGLIKASVLEGMGRRTEAIDQLQSIRTLDKGDLSDEVEWRLLLLYLKQSDEQSFEQLLDQILNDSEHLYRERAQKLKRDSRIPLRNVF